MPRLVPGIFYAVLTGVPGIWLAIWFSSPRVREKPLGELLTMFAHAIPVLFPLYAIPTVIYGALVWYLLRSLGALNLLTLVLAGMLPVLGYWSYSIFMYGWEPRALWGLGAFSIPAVFISVALWWFTIYGRAEAW